MKERVRREEGIRWREEGMGRKKRKEGKGDE